jgi:ATP-dependent exoDNAse (exonuclease V) beta subunit
MHKAKGLQYHTVILPSLSSPARASTKELLMWSEYQNNSGQAQLLLAPLRLDEQQQDGGHYNYLRQLDKKRAAQETIRLMYVACTRAEQKLILICRGKLDEETQQLKTPDRSSLLATVWPEVSHQFELDVSNDLLESEPEGIPQTLFRLPVDFVRSQKPSVSWQAQQQINAQDVEGQQNDQDLSDSVVEYEWATSVATAVGIVLHDWLQYNAHQVLNMALDKSQISQWRSELERLRVPSNRIDYAIRRLVKAVKNIQNDQSVHFLFLPREIEQNEATIATFEQGAVHHYRIDRTFVDEAGVRWVVDYKSTDTMNEDVSAFVDEQLESRHKIQLEKYGELMRAMEARPITMAVYFPVLGQFRSWQLGK